MVRLFNGYLLLPNLKSIYISTTRAPSYSQSVVGMHGNVEVKGPAGSSEIPLGISHQMARSALLSRINDQLPETIDLTLFSQAGKYLLTASFSCDYWMPSLGCDTFLSTLLSEIVFSNTYAEMIMYNLLRRSPGVFFERLVLWKTTGRGWSYSLIFTRSIQVGTPATEGIAKFQAGDEYLEHVEAGVGYMGRYRLLSPFQTCTEFLAQ